MGEHSSYGTDRIEDMFAKNIDLLHSTKNNNQTFVKKKFRLKNIFKLTSFLLKKLYKILPSLLKDIFFCLSVIHKSPSSKFFANTRYDELKMLTTTAHTTHPKPDHEPNHCSKYNFLQHDLLGPPYW